MVEPSLREAGIKPVPLDVTIHHYGKAEGKENRDRKSRRYLQPWTNGFDASTETFTVFVSLVKPSAAERITDRWRSFGVAVSTISTLTFMDCSNTRGAVPIPVP